MKVDVKFTEITESFDVNFGDKDATFKPNFTETQNEFDTIFSEVASRFAVNLEISDTEFEADLGEVIEIYGEDMPHYEGSYDVTPKVIEQTLPTARKFMAQDVNIRKIPYFSVSNNSGGNTVYIGNEV